FSGESGAATLEETLGRVASARGLDIKELYAEGLAVSASLPDIADPHSLAALDEETGPPKEQKEQWFVEMFGPGPHPRFYLVIIDPLYKCFRGGGVNSADLMSMGSALGNLVDALPGRTVVMLHHAKKDTWERRPLELGDLASAGVAEFARQWFLLNWRQPFRP